MYNFKLDQSRGREFPNLNDATYVDHVGTTLFSKTQMDAVHKDLTSNLYGNPHSHHYSSKLSTDSVDQIRFRLLRFFNASPEEYSLVFTSGCTAALKLVAQSFDFKHSHGNDDKDQGSGMFCFLQDNHTSVQGMRGHVTLSDVTSVCLDDVELEMALKKTKGAAAESLLSSSSSSTTSTTSASLFAFPAQSNFSGKRYPLSWIEQIQTHGLDLSGIVDSQDSPSPSPTPWYVLLDAASMVSTSPLPLDRIKPDFVTVSFYKIFGYPTGLGALLVHRRASHLLTKGYFGGGTVAASTAKEPFQMFRKSLHDKFEDGTLPFLSIVCVRHGLDAIQNLAGGMQAVSEHVFCVSQYFYENLTRLQHGNGQSLARVYGDVQFLKPEDQGSIVTFNLQRADSGYIGYAEVDKFAQLHDVHLRTGCFCNIGACQKYLDISSKMIRDNLDAGHVCGDNMDLIDGRPTGAVRISFGYMSTFDDAKACLRFITDSFLEDVSPMPNFPYPAWYLTHKAMAEQALEKKEEKEVRAISKSQAVDIGAGGDTSVLAKIPDEGAGGQRMNNEVSVTSGETSNVKDNEASGQNVASPPRINATSDAETKGVEKGDGGRGGRVVSDIFLYPLKSCGAFRVTEWQMGTRGLLYDREWVLVSDSGVTLGQRREPKICLINPVIDLGTRTLTLNFPEETPFELSLDQEEEALAMASLCNNKVCGDRVNTFDCGDAVADWLSNALLRPGIRLLRQLSEDTRISKQKDKVTVEAQNDQRLSLANESQMLLLNRASVRALQSKMAALGDVDEAEDSAMPTIPQDISEDNMVLRFRGNLVVDGGEAFEEEEWKSICVGENTVVCQNVCSRCSMICMDQTKAEKSREPLRTLAMWRGKKVPFGVHSRMVPNPGGHRQLITVGQTITVL